MIPTITGHEPDESSPNPPIPFPARSRHPVPVFDYALAFSRNIGWVDETEQTSLRERRVAIAGLGGVGGSHLLTLARLGVGRFHVADFDRFDVANFNRQAGATLSTVGRPKTQVLAEMARDINPEIGLRTFDAGVTRASIDEFLSGVDVYVDGLDFFAFDARSLVFAECARRGIPAVTAAPLGMGAAVLNFLPGGMTFEEYFRLEGHDDFEKSIRFLIGLSPALLQRGYLVDPSRVDLRRRSGPSTVMACQICSGLAATEALKLLLGRGKVLAAPSGHQYDAYRNRLAVTWRPFGNANPLQRIALAVARRQLDRRPAPSRSLDASASPIARVLEVARWAPSGDNTQVWRFEILGERRAVVHGFDTRSRVVYDVDGRPSQIALGALLETIRIAATAEGLRAEITYDSAAPDEQPRFTVGLVDAPDVGRDPLFESIASRAVQRRPLRTRRLTSAEKAALEAALGPGHRVVWLEGWRARLGMARLLSANGKIRLTMPEAHAVHRDVLEWRARYSEDRIPDRAVGLDPLTTALMRWALRDWRRIEFLNRRLAGTWIPRFELDFLPGLLCGAHFVIIAAREPRSLEDFVAGGAAMQRFWLTATKLGLLMQPEMTPLVFARYVRCGRRFSSVASLWDAAQSLTERVRRLVGDDVLERAVFLGRIGAGRQPASRSLRKALAALCTEESATVAAPRFERSAS